MKVELRASKISRVIMSPSCSMAFSWSFFARRSSRLVLRAISAKSARRLEEVLGVPGEELVEALLLGHEELDDAVAAHGRTSSGDNRYDNGVTFGGARSGGFGAPAGTVHGEARARADLARHGHGRAHALGQVAHDGEARAPCPRAAAARLVHAVEALEDPGQVLGGDAGAVVLTTTTAAPPPSRRACTSTLPPAGVYLTAFSTRFSRIRRSRSASVVDLGGAVVADGERHLLARGQARRARRPRPRRSRRAPRARSAAAARPDSSRESSSRSSTSAAMRSAWARILPRKRWAFAGSVDRPVLQRLHEAADRGERACAARGRRWPRSRGGSARRGGAP